MEMTQLRAGESSNSFNNSFNTRNSFNKTVLFNNTTFSNVGNVNNLSGEILAWLSPLDPRIRHDDIRAHRVEHVGDWLLRTEEYRNWFAGIRGGKSDNPALFCYGEPGVGKTYISSLVIDRLCDWARGKDATVGCFYFDFAAQKEQSPESILSSLLKQVVGGLEEIPAKIVRAFQGEGKGIGGRRLGLGEIVEMLQDITSSRPTFICIDALDECTDRNRAKLLDSLKQILHKSPNTRIFLAGRLHIREEVEKHLAGRVVAISVTPSKGDIDRFLRARMREDTVPDAMDKRLEEEIIKTILEKFSEIFLLVSLNIKAILQERTLLRRREKLGTMTNGLGLGGAYDATIQRVRAQEGDGARLGMEALMWLSHSGRPLKVDEICHALAVHTGSTEIDPNNVPSIRTVLGCCQGLAAVDKGSSTIRLIHITLKEHLSCNPGLFDRTHSKMAETCLTYLNFRAIKDLLASLPHDTQSTPFLEYSSLYWGTHMRMDLSDLSSHSRCAALDLLNQYDNHISAKLLWRSIIEPCFKSFDPFPALHCISYFGITKIAIDLITTKGWDVNQRDRAGLTPLMWAAMHGHRDAVEFLLQREDTQPDMLDAKCGRTALSWAAGSGHEEVVRLFVSRRLFITPGSVGRRWVRTPQVMSILFGRKYVNPDRPDNDGRTPLSWAAENGNNGVVKLLLAREDVSPDRPGNYGQTPLSWAARNGHDKVVKLLLRREDVSPDRPGNYGQTPLSWAARNGHDGIVKLLLGWKGVCPDSPDNCRQTPLSWAAENGHDGVVKLLLEREGVSPNGSDTEGQTPLLWACRNGHDRVVKLLLERDDIDPDKPDIEGRTPLLWATVNGHSGVVGLLLGRGNIGPERPGSGSQALLSRAAGSAYGVVEQQLGWGDVSLDEPDIDGEAPLLWAARNGYSGVVNLLLRREGCSPGSLESGGKELLSWAARNGHDKVVKLLLEQGDVIPDSRDADSQTPLSWAARNGHSGVVKLLLGRGDVSPDRPDNYGQTPLSWAAENGHDGVVKLLLGRKDVSPHTLDSSSRTPLSWATLNGHEGVIKLLGWEDVSPAGLDSRGQAMLSWATRNGYAGVVGLLRAPPWYKATEMWPLLTSPNLAMYLVYKISRHFTALSTIPSDPHSTPNVDGVVLSTSPFVSAGNVRLVSGARAPWSEIYGVD